MATDLEELIRWWKDYLGTQLPVFHSPLRENIKSTIVYLVELKEAKESRKDD